MIVTLKQKQYNFISRWWNNGIGGNGLYKHFKNKKENNLNTKS